MILDYEPDLESVKKNHRAKYLGPGPSSLKLIGVCLFTDRHIPDRLLCLQFCRSFKMFTRGDRCARKYATDCNCDDDSDSDDRRT